mmetsp:Transcript_94646/g.276709  ORF Transcript_94646/g.276709 Transcript_94646/m.276709 type:complete len:278 (+) Transcript_94646:334-1167(+)
MVPCKNSTTLSLKELAMERPASTVAFSWLSSASFSSRVVLPRASMVFVEFCSCSVTSLDTFLILSAFGGFRPKPRMAASIGGAAALSACVMAVQRCSSGSMSAITMDSSVSMPLSPAALTLPRRELLNSSQCPSSSSAFSSSIRSVELIMEAMPASAVVSSASETESGTLPTAFLARSMTRPMTPKGNAPEEALASCATLSWELFSFFPWARSLRVCKSSKLMDVSCSSSLHTPLAKPEDSAQDAAHATGTRPAARRVTMEMRETCMAVEDAAKWDE